MNDLMKLVLDANILFSALIKESYTRELLLNSELKIYTPEFILEEFFKYIDLLSKKSKVSKKELINLVKKLIILSNIQIIPIKEFKNYIKEAKSISPDLNDVLYFALALKMKCSIWSNDKELKNQNKIRVYSIKDLIEIL